MISAPNFFTPKEAVREMLAAGALFDVRRREDALGFSFTYRVTDGGDAARCRDILAAVKARPPIFYQAFRTAVQDATWICGDVGGVATSPSAYACVSPGRHLDDAETPPTLRTRSERGAA